MGLSCRYNGEGKVSKEVMKLGRKERLIPVCPEQLGGLPTPRKPTGIYGGLGEDVLKCGATVRAARDGEDQTEKYIRGAHETLMIARLLDAKDAILKQGSPSCGCGKTWQLDDKFFNHLVKGDGVTAALLKKNSIRVMTEEDLE